MSAHGTQVLSFIAISLYFMVGIEDMFTFPRLLQTYKESIALFLGFNLAMTLLVGVPAFAEDCTLFLTEGEHKGRWWRGYHMCMMIQVTQAVLSTCYELFTAAVAQMYSLLSQIRGLSDKSLMSLNGHVCHRGRRNVTTDLGSGDVLKPACRQPGVKTGPLFCWAHSLMTNTRMLVLYTCILLSVIFPVYIMFLRNNSGTYGLMSRLYLALILLCSCTLVLHFIDTQNGDNSMLLTELTQHWEVGLDFGYRVLSRCLQSLGLFSFGASILGGHATPVVKRNFVGIVLAIAMLDFSFTCLFTWATIMYRTAVMVLCKFAKADQLEVFMYWPTGGDPGATKNPMSVAVLEPMQSILMQTRTSGRIPWTVYLPFILLSTAVLTMKGCNYLFVSDLHVTMALRYGWSMKAATRRTLTLTISALRLALFLMLNLALIAARSGQDFLFILKDSMQLSYFVLKISHSLRVCCTQGITEYLRQKRSLLRDTNGVQVFLFDWYIGPSIRALMVLGYPILLVSYACASSAEFQDYCYTLCVLGSSLMMLLLLAAVHFLGDSPA